MRAFIKIKNDMQTSVSLCATLLALFAFLLFPQTVFAQSAFEDPGVRTGSGSAGDLIAVEPRIDAGSVALGAASQVVVLFRNDSGKPITSGSISLYPSSNVSASVGENECIQQPLPTSAVCAMAISIKGLQVGRFRIEMLMRHDGRTKLITTTVSGTVERSDDASADIISDLETIPSEVKFQDLKDSRPLTRSVIMRNVTSEPIEVLSMDIQSNEQAGFTMNSNCEKLLSGEACISTVTWAPKQRGPSTGVLVVNHDGPTGVVSIPLDGDYQPSRAEQVGIFPEAVPGKGLLTASQTSFDFGNGIESSSAITVSLVNVGDSLLEIDDISLSNNDNGISIAEGGCGDETTLEPVQACALTLVWDPVREGTILDDVQVVHDGARGILVLPIKGTATRAVNKDSRAVVMNSAPLRISDIPPVSAADVEYTPPQAPAPLPPPTSASGEVAGNNSDNAASALEGFKVTSLAKTRAIISGPGGSRVVSNNQETVIGGVLWRIAIRANAVEFFGGGQRILLLFDHSLSFTGNDRTSSSTSSGTPATVAGGSDGN